MIKINYKGFAVEVETVAEAKELIEASPTPSVRAYTKRVKAHRRKKKGRYNRWELGEIRHIVNLIENGQSASDVRRDHTLRERHGKTSIQQMYYNVKNNVDDTRVSKEIGEVIHEFHGNKISVNKIR